MPVPDPPIDFTDYNTTLSEYQAAATDLDNSNANRNAAFADLQAAQAAYDAANDAQLVATGVASDKLGAHTAAAAEIGVEPATPAPTYKR